MRDVAFGVRYGMLGEVSPLAFLREVPTLTHLHLPPTSTKEYERSRNADTPMSDPVAGRQVRARRRRVHDEGRCREGLGEQATDGGQKEAHAKPPTSNVSPLRGRGKSPIAARRG